MLVADGAEAIRARVLLTVEGFPTEKDKKREEGGEAHLRSLFCPRHVHVVRATGLRGSIVADTVSPALQF